MKPTIFCRSAMLAVVTNLFMGIPTLLSNPQAVESYLVFAREDIVIGHDVTIQTGDLGANQTVIFRERATTSPATAIRADHIRLGPKVTVGNLQYNDLQAHPTAAIRSKTPELALPIVADFPDVDPAHPGDQDIAVNAGASLVLDAGRYRQLVVKPNGTLILSGGRYDLTSLRLWHDVCVLVDDDAELIVAEQIAVGHRCVVNRSLANVRLVIRSAGTDEVVIRSGTRLQAVVEAPAAWVTLGHDVVFEGRIVAHAVQVRSCAVLTFNPLDGSQPPPTTPDAFTLFAKTKLTVGKAAEIVEGQIGANGRTNDALEFHRQASTAPELFLFADGLTLDAGVVVGRAFFNRLRAHRTAVVLEPHSPVSTPIVDVFPQVPPFAPGTVDLFIPKNAVRAIQPGAYRDLQIGKNCSITFQPGEYRLRRLTIEKDAEIAFTDFTVLFIRQSMTVGKNVRFNETLPRQDVRIFYDGSGAVTFDADGVVSISRLLAPYAAVSWGKNASFAGAVWADKIEIGQESVMRMFDVAPPETVAVPPGGMYNQDQFVELLAEEPADIFFTTDGSEPTSSSSRFTDPIEIAENTTLRFFGVDDSANVEDPNTELYVIDTVAPVIAIGGVSNGQVTGDAVTPAITVSDVNLAAVTILLNGHEYTVGTPIIVEGDHSLFVSADDLAGNTSTHSMDFTIDKTPPILIMPPDVALECPADTSITSTGAAVAEDICGVPVITFVDRTVSGCGSTVTIIRTWTASDHCGNATNADQTITLVDSTPPALTGVPAAVTVECGTIPRPPVVTAADSCDPNLVVTFSELIESGSPPRRTILRTWTAVDACGNSTTAMQTLTVLDTNAPEITLLGDNPQRFECPESYVESGATAADSCDGDISVAIVIDSSSVNPSVSGEYSVIYSVTDAAGNSVLATRTVIVRDTTPPNLTGVPADLSVECGEIPDPAAVTAVDSCDSNPIVTFSETESLPDTALCAPLCPLRIIDRVWTATDVSGNTTSATQPLTVFDTISPWIALLGDSPQIVECSETYVESGATATDSCDGDLSSMIAIGSNSVNGSIPGDYSVSYSVSDAAGNSASTTRTVTVVDTTPPTLVGVPAELTVECSAVPEPPIVTATDFCDPQPVVVFAETASDEVCFPATIVRTWTSIDANGNQSSAQQIISVIDITPPTISITGISDEEVTDQEVTPVIVVSDLCQPLVGECQLEITILLNDDLYFSETAIAAPGDYTLSVTSRDRTGNTASTTIHFTIESTDPLLRDSDGDGLTDIEEIEYETDPLNPDSDSDGFDDATEIANSTDPAPPRDVTNVETASFANDSVTIRWTHSTSDDIVGYLYHIDPIPTLFYIGFVNELTLPRPPGANSISGAIHARDRVGNTTHSSPFYATWPDDPQPPTSLAAYYDHPKVILVLGRSPTAAVDKYIIDYDAFDLQGNLLADDVPIEASPYPNWTGDQALQLIEVNGLAENRRYLFRALSLDLGAGYAGGIASDPAHSPTAEVTTSKDGFINLSELKRNISARQISLYLDCNNDKFGGEISATVWSDALGSAQEELVPIRNSLTKLGEVIFSEGKDYQTCNVKFIEQSYTDCDPHINFQAVYDLEGWEHVLLPGDMGIEFWSLGVDLNDDGVPDKIDIGHQEEVELAFDLLTTWIRASEEEIIMSSVIDPVVTTHWESFFGGSDNEYSFDWWADRFGDSMDPYPLYHPQYFYFKASELGDGGFEPLTSTSTVKMSALFPWKPLSSMIDVEAVSSINFGKIKLGTNQEITYSFNGPPPVDKVNSFVATNLSVCGRASGGINNSPPLFDYRFFKQMKDQVPTLESVTYTANGATVSAAIPLVVMAGQRVIIHATAHYRVDLAVGPIYFDVPMPIKLKSTGGLAKVIQPSTFVAIKEGFEYEVIADLPAGNTTDAAVKVVVPKVDLDVMKVSHNTADGELPEEQETSPGAFVPINNDDDDYDASNAADKDQPGAIIGESDLLPIKLNKVEPAITGSKYTLEIPSQVKIWQNADRTGAINGTAELDANVDIVLYIEGFTVGSGNIKINWKYGSTIFDACDEIKVTVFGWLGPLNVPDYSIHRYSASGALGSSQWGTPVNGTIKTGAGSSDITVLWSGGPIVGKSVYQANAHYIWELEVNVVEIKIEDPSSGDAFTAGSTPLYQGDVNFGVLGPVVASGVPGINPGIRWKARVTINGPNANGVDHRGVTHIEVGFVQNLTFVICRGDFTVSGIPQSLTANIEGGSYLDIINNQPAGTVYYFNDDDHTFKPTETEAGLRTKDPLAGEDSPSAGVPLYYKKGTGLNPPNDDFLDSMHWAGAFSLWITARTDDTVNHANGIYTCRAKANWKFTVNEVYPLIQPLAGTNVTVPNAWSSVSDGSTPTLITGQTANQALAGITY